MKNSRILLKMKELEVESTGVNGEETTDDDSDLCDTEELQKIFETPTSSLEHCIAKNSYILNIDATLETEPNVALTLSDNTCHVYNLSNNQFAESAVFAEHSDVITEVKFSRKNSNLLYTGSHDGTVKLWDLRASDKSAVEFKDTTVQDEKHKEITCFDLSPNNLLLAAGTNLFEADSFILFWDLRNHSLLGGYWESHTDDITQVKFHSDDSNKLISGSVDGLINVYDLSQSSEEDAFIDCLNTESSVEKLAWLPSDIISCITHTADVQFWKIENAQPYFHLHRNEVAMQIRRKSDHIYVVNVHNTKNSILLLAGSNHHDGECLRGLSIVGNNVKPAVAFPQNQQRVRSSWLNPNTGLLVCAGEKGIVNTWNVR